MISVQALLEKFPLGLEGPPPEKAYEQQSAQLHAEVCAVPYIYTSIAS